MIQMRVTSSLLWVDVRVLEVNGRWIASADTPDGPSLGPGESALAAIDKALQPFEGIVEKLHAKVPHRGLDRSRRFSYAPGVNLSDQLSGVLPGTPGLRSASDSHDELDPALWTQF